MGDGAIGDFDGDGAADLAVGAPQGIPFDADRPGRVAVFLGPIAPGSTSFDRADLLFRGSSEPDAFGMTLGAGDVDVDGDGRDDLVVGAPFDDTRDEDAGAVYLFAGTTLFP